MTGKNLVYETWCMSCYRKDVEEVEMKWAGDEKKMQTMKDKIKKHLYVGETSRSVYKRAFEHQYDVEQLKTYAICSDICLRCTVGKRGKMWSLA